MLPQIITIFNNKGGVGKTTLTYHMAHALALRGKKTLVIDLDPQCNFSIMALEMEFMHNLWIKEDDFVDDYDQARRKSEKKDYDILLNSARSIHFLLKPTEDGTAELEGLPPVITVSDNVDLIAGRLTLHLYEAKLSERWNGIYLGDPLSIRTATRVRSLAYEYSKKNGYDIVILDTSPSLGTLNRNLLTLADGFIIPCNPDLFSVYGVRNIGSALEAWKKQFDSMTHFISGEKRKAFPEKFVRLLGYTIYNAKKRSDSGNKWMLARAHYNYAKEIPNVLMDKTPRSSMISIDEDAMREPIGGTAIMHTHNTFPAMSQKYHVPMWSVPAVAKIEPDDIPTISANRERYYDLKDDYLKFVDALLERMEKLT